MLYDNNRLYQSVEELGIIEKKLLDECKVVSEKRNLPLGVILLERGLVSEEDLGQILADILDLPFVRLSRITIPEDLLRLVPEVVARKQRFVAYFRNEDGLHVATSDPANIEGISFFAQKVGEKVILHFTTDKDLEHAFSSYKKDVQKSFDELLKEQVDEANNKVVKDVPIAKIVDLLVDYAHSNGASDIHIEPTTESTYVRYRIDGILHDILTIPKSLHEQVISRIKVISKLRTDEHLSAQDGKMRRKFDDEEFDIRVSTVPITNGEKAVLRLLSAKREQYNLNSLGMQEKDLNKVKQGFLKPFGMVLITGPTGSGKTTTIYSILKILNTRDKNISTIEDPVEYELQGLNQIQVNPKSNLTFAQGLRSLLRQDPDIVFVGEIRDDETASIAINSALTGHLVLSTLHTNDAATSLPRFIDMHVEPFLIASTINVIIAQRLVRKICDKCKSASTVNRNTVNKTLSDEILDKYFGQGETITSYKGLGCAICHFTGYKGRIGIFEVLNVSDSIRELITTKANVDKIRAKAREEGMTVMIEDGLIKVQRGMTTIEEVLRAAKE